MNSFLRSFALSTALLAAIVAHADVFFDFGTSSLPTTSASSGVPPHLSVSPFSVVNQVGAFGGGHPLITVQADGTDGPLLAHTLPPGPFNLVTSGYYSITITPDVDHLVLLSDFDFTVSPLAAPGSFTPTTYILLWSEDGFSNPLFSGPLLSGWNRPETTIAGGPLKSATFGAPVTLRLYALGDGPIQPGLFNLRIDDVSIDVEAAVPESSKGAILACATMVAMTCWNRFKRAPGHPNSAASDDPH